MFSSCCLRLDCNDEESLNDDENYLFHTNSGTQTILIANLSGRANKAKHLSALFLTDAACCTVQVYSAVIAHFSCWLLVLRLTWYILDCIKWYGKFESSLHSWYMLTQINRLHLDVWLLSDVPNNCCGFIEGCTTYIRPYSENRSV